MFSSVIPTRSAATLGVLSFAMLIVSLDQYIVVVALPDIGRDLGYSAQTLQSVISAYAVASSGFLLFAGHALICLYLPSDRATLSPLSAASSFMAAGGGAAGFASAGGVGSSSVASVADVTTAGSSRSFK